MARVLELDASRLAPKDWPHVLEALVRISTRQRRAGLAPALSQTRTVYRREPRGQEIWQTAQRTHELGHGDCEDLSIALASDFRHRGIPARVVTRKVRPGLRHAVVLLMHRGKPRLIDPSRARGMGRKR